jgi:hypothetical protein
MMPVILKTADTGEWIKLVLYTFVLPHGDARSDVYQLESVRRFETAVGGITDDKKMFIHFENDQGIFNVKGT